MKLKNTILAATFLAGTSAVFAQTNAPKAAATPLTAEVLTHNIESAKQFGVSSERRMQAYQKLLEGQRYIWKSSRLRSQTGIDNNSRLAKQALQKAVELDPTLAEGYTALAEIAATIDEAQLFANIAAKINPDNYGAHRILARIYTVKSRLETRTPVPEFAGKAVIEWQELTRLDPRNSEAWAFLAEFYGKSGKVDEQINALKKWRAGAAPLDASFYKRLTGGAAELTPDSASLKLAAAQLKKGDTLAALESVNLVIADAPENTEAVELLRQTVESADGDSSVSAMQSLQQAVFANPSNVSLIALLAEVQSRAGKTDEAAKTLRGASAKLLDADKNSAANLQVALGDLYAGKNRVDEAAKAYQQAFLLRGAADENQPVTDEDRDFTISVYEKLIQLYKNANRPNDVKAVIEKSRQILGKNDLFADSQTIAYYRETGKKAEALAAVRVLRVKYPGDYGMLRLEAQILTESGKVDEAAALVRGLLKKNQVLRGVGPSAGKPVNYDDFSNYLFISSLYTQANRGKEAVESANLALTAANGEERKQIAELMLASAQQSAGDYKSAEETLRGILKKTPDNPVALNNLGYFLLERDEKIGEAFDLISAAVKIEPENPSYLDSLGWAYFKQNKFAEAENYLTKAAGFDQTSATIQDHLGDVYQKNGKPELAKSAWQKALNLAGEAKEIARIKAKIK